MVGARKLWVLHAEMTMESHWNQVYVCAQPPTILDQSIDQQKSLLWPASSMGFNCIPGHTALFWLMTSLRFNV